MMRREQLQLGTWDTESTEEPYETLERPPFLRGYIYDHQDAYKARNSNRLLSLRVEANMACNLSCRYCHARGVDTPDIEMPYEDLKALIKQARDMGAESIIIVGGEPTIHTRLHDIINVIYSLGMTPVIASNMIDIDTQLAQFLYASNASVLGKIDSFYRELQDFLSGKRGAWERIRLGLYNLKKAGFTQPADPHRSRLGLSFMANRLNMVEMDEMWHFCRQHDMFPNLGLLPPAGRAKHLPEGQLLSLEEIRDCKLRLLRLDRDYYGYDWLPYTPVPGSGCLQHLYSLYVTAQGNVRPCGPTRLEENPGLQEDGVYPYNIRRMSLRDIFESSLFEHIRNIDQHLEGKCSECEHLAECIGCRGHAYNVATAKGLDPFTALRSECPYCFKEPGV